MRLGRGCLEFSVGLGRFLKVGKIVGTRGIRGELKVKPFCDSPHDFCEIDKVYFGDMSSLNMLSRRVFKGLVLIRLDGIDSVDSAGKFVGRDLFASKDNILLPEGRYFIEDIIGMDVIDAKDGTFYGKIINILQNGAHDVYIVKKDDSRECFLPAVKEMVKKIDIDRRVIVVDPIKGIFDDEF